MASDEVPRRPEAEEPSLAGSSPPLVVYDHESRPRILTHSSESGVFRFVVLDSTAKCVAEGVFHREPSNDTLRIFDDRSLPVVEIGREGGRIRLATAGGWRTESIE